MGKEIPGKSFSMFKRHGKVWGSLVANMVISSINIGFYIPRKGHISIILFGISPIILWGKQVIFLIAKPSLSEVKCLVWGHRDCEWCGQGMNLGFLSPNPELCSILQCIVQYGRNALSCFILLDGEVFGERNWILRTRWQMADGRVQCQAKEASYICKLSRWKEKQEGKNINIFWRKTHIIVGIKDRGRGLPFTS